MQGRADAGGTVPGVAHIADGVAHGGGRRRGHRYLIRQQVSTSSELKTLCSTFFAGDAPLQHDIIYREFYRTLGPVELSYKTKKGGAHK